MTDDSDEGLFTRGSKRRAESRALAFRDSSQPLQKVAATVASGADVQADAQRVMLKLATYGEGDRLGKYAFSSTELINDLVIPVYASAVEPVAAVSAGSRLRDAVSYLKSRGYADTTEDGEFAPGTDFHEVKLTTLGRDATQSFVKKHVSANGGGEGDRMPSLFDDLPGGPAPPMAPSNDRDTFTAMLSRARIRHGVEHDEDGGVTHVEVKTSRSLGYFTFDVDGKLLGVSKNHIERDGHDEEGEES